MNTSKQYLLMVFLMLGQFSVFADPVLKQVGSLELGTSILGPLKPSQGSSVYRKMGIHYNACEIGLYHGAKINELYFPLTSFSGLTTFSDIIVYYRNNNRARLILDESWVNPQNTMDPSTVIGTSIMIPEAVGEIVTNSNGQSQLKLSFLNNSSIDYRGSSLDIFIEWTPVGSTIMQVESYESPQGVAVWGDNYFHSYGNKKPRVVLGNGSGSFYGLNNSLAVSTIGIQPCHQQQQYCPHQSICLGLNVLDVEGQMIQFDQFDVNDLGSFSWTIASPTLGNYTISTNSPQLSIPPDELSPNHTYNVYCSFGSGYVSSSFVLVTGGDLNCNDAFLGAEGEDGSRIVKVTLSRKASLNADTIFDPLLISQTQGPEGTPLSYFSVQTRRNASATFQTLATQASFIINSGVNYTRTDFAHAIAQMSDAIPEFSPEDSIKVDVVMNKRAKPMMNHRIRIRFDFDGNGSYETEKILHPNEGTPPQDLPQTLNEFFPYFINTSSSIINYKAFFKIPCNILPDGNIRFEVVLDKLPTGWNEREEYTIKTLCPTPLIAYSGADTVCVNAVLPFTASVPSGCIGTYEWFDENGQSVETGSSFTPTTSGTYTVKFTTEDCIKSSLPITIVILPLVVQYADADGDGYGDLNADTLSCDTLAGFVLNNTDCNDANALLHTVSVEICNDFDDDCDGTADNGLTFVNYYNDVDGDGFGAGTASNLCADPGAGYVTNNTDCNDGNPLLNSISPESCNGFDDDCDGTADNGLTFVNYYNDIDGDGFGAGPATNACQSPAATYVTNNTDCDDGALAIYPGATEACNTVDDDCDALVDEGCALGAALLNATYITSMPQFGLTGGNYSQNVNMALEADTPENGGNYPEKWFKFVAQSNAVRIALTGASAADDNAIAIYDDPGLSYSSPLIPISLEDDVNLSSTGVTDQGNEILLTDQLVEGNTYYVAVATVGGVAGTINVKFNTLMPSSCDIATYTGGTNTFSNVCSNFKCRYRQNAKRGIVHRWSSSTIAGMPLQSYTIPPTTIMYTVCQLSKFVPANISAVPQTIYVSADVQYELLDAAGNMNYLTAISNSTCSFILNPEAYINLRSTDACPNYKTTTSSLATDRSVCGTSQYQWEFTQAFPVVGLPINVNGSVGGSRILGVNSIPGVANGQRYDLRIRSLHNDNVTYSGWSLTASCFKTLGAAGMAPWTDFESKHPFEKDGHVIVYPNPSLVGSTAKLQSNSELKTVEVYSNSGQLLARLDGLSQIKSIDLPAIEVSGLYWVVAHAGNDSQRIAWLIQ